LRDILFSDEDKVLIKNLHQFKKYGLQMIMVEFSEKKLKKEKDWTIKHHMDHSL